MCVTLTRDAATFMRRMIRLGQAGSSGGFRLAVKPGGCSGFDASFSIEQTPLAGDSVVEQEGVRVFLEAASCELLRGYTIDFKESRLDGGLSFSKPGAVQSCCGSGRPATTATVSFAPRPGTFGAKKCTTA